MPGGAGRSWKSTYLYFLKCGEYTCLGRISETVRYRKTGIFLSIVIVLQDVVNNFIPMWVCKTWDWRRNWALFCAVGWSCVCPPGVLVAVLASSWEKPLSLGEPEDPLATEGEESASGREEVHCSHNLCSQSFLYTGCPPKIYTLYMIIKSVVLIYSSFSKRKRIYRNE